MIAFSRLKEENLESGELLQASCRGDCSHRGAQEMAQHANVAPTPHPKCRAPISSMVVMGNMIVASILLRSIGGALYRTYTRHLQPQYS